jgi:hypothetical protein
MSVYSRAVFRVIVACALIAGTISLWKPLSAEAFACPQPCCPPICRQQYNACLAKCGTNTACRQQCAIALSDCCP